MESTETAASAGPAEFAAPAGAPRFGGPPQTSPRESGAPREPGPVPVALARLSAALAGPVELHSSSAEPAGEAGCDAEGPDAREEPGPGEAGCDVGRPYCYYYYYY